VKMGGRGGPQRWVRCEVVERRWLGGGGGGPLRDDLSEKEGRAWVSMQGEREKRKEQEKMRCAVHAHTEGEAL
jgi:hypothetical protein